MSASPLPPTPTDFSGLWVPLVTPFAPTPDGLAVDHAALAALTQRLCRDGVHGFVVCGTTGEAAALSHDEQLACLRTVAQHAGGKPLVMGVGGEQWQSTRDWVVRLTGPDSDVAPLLSGLLLTAPHYIRPSQAGLRQWFESLADASAVPVLIYDIPYRTGAVLSRDTLLALAAHPRIQGIKDCGGDLGKTQALIADGRLQVLAGEDLAAFSTVALGGAGAIAASLHLHTPHFVAWYSALREGQLAQAREAWRRLLPMMEALFSEPNPGPLKAALALQGEGQAHLRPPLAAPTAATVDSLRRILTRP
jgi:4-hydroxy-tetrahydrodipicolinate synthase